jgi:serine/threonine-protein kinase
MLPPADEDGEGSGAWQVAGYVVLGLLTIAAVALTVLWVGGAFDSGPAVDQVTVPSVINESQTSAQDILAERGLRLSLGEPQNSDTVAEGFVISQSPEPGELVDADSPVEIVVSLGVESIEVPDLGGLTEEDARARLREVDLLPGRIVREANDEVEAGVVISSDPSAGTQVAPGEPVDLVVSSGEELVLVRNVVGLVDADARSALQDQDLLVEVFQVFSDGVPEGRVVSQDPAAGEEVPVGSTVVLEISRGPAEPSPEPSPEPTETPTPTPTDTPTPDPTTSPTDGATP